MTGSQYTTTGGNQNRAGSVGASVSNSPTQNRFPTQYGWGSADEVAIYEEWANLYTGYDDYFQLNNYFDYFFTGQDIQVYIEGLTEPQDVLPIYQFGYNVQQNKQPLYGFWSYTYDTMLRGTRIVTGAFSVITPSPGFVTEKVAKAASVRSQRSNQGTLYPVRGLNEDDANIETYWRRNYDSNLDQGQKHLFSVHPPFNLVVVYGVQDTSLSGNGPQQRSEELRQKFLSSTAMMGDINERLVESDQDDNSMRILIENVELVSRQTEYTPEGDPVLETYSFMARDIREAPRPRVGTNVQASGGSGSGPGRVFPGQVSRS
jgi:hypothetical protein